MTSETEMNAIKRRLDCLEKQNRRLKRAGVAALVVVGAVVLTGQSAPKSRTIEAETFVLRDGQGRVRAMLSTSKDPSPIYPSEVDAPPGPALELFAENGKLSTRLQETKLTLFERGIDRVSLAGSSKEGQWMLRFFTAGWGAPLTLGASDQAFMVLQGDQGQGSRLKVSGFEFLDKDGRVIWRAP